MTLRLLCFFLPALTTFLQAGEFPALYNTEKEEHPPMTAEEASQTATLPEGFRLEVFASEPQVQQPISIAFDDSDRLWVAECYTFAERPLRWDMELRDRILVLEDTDKDGKADSRTVFWDQGKRLTSALPGKGGVWAVCSPQLLFIPDADNDLVPDGDPVVMLDGFDAENIGHNIVNGLKWGPDGWLYGRHGITSTSLVGVPGTPKSRRTALNCSIWRFHPETHKFEVFCNGGTNPWGLDWNRDGQLFYTNTVIGHLWHAIPGAYYKRMFGAHLNPHVYELITHTADHYHWDTGAEKWNDAKKGVTNSTSSLGGGHAHMGCLIYEGGVWPDKYRGNLYTCNLHGRRINQEILEREGVGYVARHADDFLMMEDPWFRGLDLITGPDGQVWMNDWSDTGECHDNDGIHRTSGRIYRIVYDGPEKPVYPLRSWSVQGTLQPDSEEGKKAMQVRRLSESAPGDKATQDTLLSIAKDNPEGLVRLELASSLQRLPGASRFQLAETLCRYEEDADDRQQPLMIWYGIADVVPEHTGPAVELALSSKLPKLTELITRRLAEAIESNGTPLNDLLSKSDTESSEAILTGMAAGLKGWSKAPMPPAWASFSKTLPGDKHANTIRELSLLFGDGRARQDLIEIVKDGLGDPGARRAALRNLLRQPDEALLPMLKSLATDRILATEAVRGLSAYDDPEIPGKVIGFWNRFPMDRSVAIDTLVSRPSYATALLNAVGRGQIPGKAISPFQARQIVSLGNEKLQQKLKEVWGEIRETPAEKIAEKAEWQSILTAEAIASADPVKGKTVFTTACGACHRLYGEGGQIGPDLTGSDRHSLDYLLDNTVNPNDVVPADYRLTVLTLKDGRVISGVVPEENENTVSIQSATERLIVNKSEIGKRETMPVSLMPEGLLKSLGRENVKNLVAWLMTTSPLPE